MVLPHPQTGEEAGSSFDNGHGHGNGQPDQHQLRQYDQYAQYQQQGGGRTGSAYPRYQQQQQQMGRYTGTAVPAGGEEGFPRVTSLDLLNTIANLNSSSASLDNYNVDAGAIKQEQQLYHAQRAHGGGGADMQDPTPDVFPALALATNSSTFTLGEAWPSFSNFNAFGGGSMDDLTAAAANSNSAESLVQEGMYKPSSLSVDDSNSIGYPLEDGSSTVTGTASSASVSNSSSSSSCDDKCTTVPSAHKASLSSSGLASGEAVEAVSAAAPSSSVRAAGDASSTGPLLSSAAFLQAQQQQRAQVQVRVQAPIVDVAGMSSMAHMYQPAFALPSSRSNGSISNSGADNGSGNGSGSSNVPVDNRSSESEHLLAGTMVCCALKNFLPVYHQFIYTNICCWIVCNR